ncbi:MAG: hypothetical protein GF383_03145, partial [Candidatus Lokiarchaeota archaeon]|nr:hypothetical protein [Candidatus Lokiarchaeota archaeon]MBD3338559.1 hypothetical protein [Candidatus Lokiarchaeota archaeon]
MSQYTINEYLSLKLEGEDSVIYVKGEKFIICKYLLINIPINKISEFDEIQSIDEAADNLDTTLDPIIDEFGEIHRKNKIPPEVEFWGHCSNIQVWVENDYNTRLLASNIAFPLLKKLADAGDSKAQLILKEEIVKRLDTGYLPVVLYLMNSGYLKYLDKEELLSSKFFRKISDIRKFRKYVFDLEPKTVKEWISKAILLSKFNLEEWSDLCFEVAIKKFPENEELRIQYALELEERGENQKALGTLLDLTKIAPYNPIHWIRIGSFMLDRKKFENAVKYLKKALEINPQLFSAKLKLARAWHNLNKHPKRDEILSELISLGNLSHHELRALVFFCSEILMLKESVSLFKKLLLKVPDDPRDWYGLAITYREMGKLYHQRRCLKKSIRFSSDPNLISKALNFLGQSYVENGNLIRGIDLLYEAVKSDPYNAAAWFNQTRVQVVLLDLERGELSVKIQKKIEELNQATELGENFRVST